MATIKAIESRSVHQIQSGQVIVDLCSVVKELVENSLDAGASSIEVRFKNHGLDSIEVQDNGKGIAPDDFETVALKHYTSKLSSYEDLSSLDTFGFRGEALSSLCALSKFHIITARAEDGAVGKRLDFEVSGKLKSVTVAAAQKGTTVSVGDLFYNLPVRRRELEKNIKREYGKVIAYLHAYACISVGVRFSVTNQMSKGKKNFVFSTKPNSTTKENIVNVFGAKTMLALIKLDLELEMEPSLGPTKQSLHNRAAQATDRSMKVQVQGHISKPIFGEGRQAPDRQMFFVNSRPCQLPQVSKAVNEVYKSFNVSQSPFIFINLIMDTNAYDVNVSPDKRSIMLHDQTALLESLKTALTELFERTDHTVPQSTLPNRKLPAYQPLSAQRSIPSDDTQAGIAEDGLQVESAVDDDNASLVENEVQSEVNLRHKVHPGSPPILPHTWLGQDAEDRGDLPPSKPHGVGTLSKDKAKLGITMQKHDGRKIVDNDLLSVGQGDNDVQNTDFAQSLKHTSKDRATIASPPNKDSLDIPCRDPFSEQPQHLKTPALAQQRTDKASTTPAVAKEDQQSALNVQIPSARIASHLESSSQEEESQDEGDLAGAEQPIPAIKPGSQISRASLVQNAFDRMRPKRTPIQTAEITIGNNTTTTIIGSGPMYKKRRIHAPQNSQSIALFGGSPLLARGLRSFAAPGSQLAVDNSEAQQSANSTSDSDAPLSESEDDEDGEEPNGNEQPKSTIQSLKDRSTPDPLDQLSPVPGNEDDLDADYVDEDERRIKDNERVARLIQEAEQAAARPSEANLRRASQALRSGAGRKQSTLQLTKALSTSIADIGRRAQVVQNAGKTDPSQVDSERRDNTGVKDELNDANAESKLSLTVSKSDFESMRVSGQFNLGFILALRPAAQHDGNEQDQDELFIVDQHAADEKYNYERLQRTVVLQSQRLVRPKPLDLTAIEEEIILNHSDVLRANGFEIEVSSSMSTEEEDNNGPVRQTCRLLTLPISGEKTFDLSDLEELLHLLNESPPSSSSSYIPRPRKVQRMLAMRACRSSIMIGRTLTEAQMRKVVRHMGEMDKPWNCPHGRPTMRHLAGLGAWRGWREGEVVDEEDEVVVAGRVDAQTGAKTDWRAWLERRRAG